MCIPQGKLMENKIYINKGDASTQNLFWNFSQLQSSFFLFILEILSGLFGRLTQLTPQNRNLLLLPLILFFSVLFIISFQPYLSPVYHQFPTFSGSCLSSVFNIIWVLFIISYQPLQVLFIIIFQPYLSPLYHPYPTLSGSCLSSVSNLI